MLLFFDKEIVTIVLDNLISNAIKYTEQGCITLSLYQTVRNEVAYTEIKVSDTGYGISCRSTATYFRSVTIRKAANIRHQEPVLVWLW